ncbi:MAG: hypothetical protein HQK89_04290 [Nitrospirae bacterium]|nr:hypothetical protein [Nitrospirota bacterium]
MQSGTEEDTIQQWIDDLREGNYGSWDMFASLGDRDRAKLIKHYISSYCSQPHDENREYLCRELIINYIICQMNILFAENFDSKMDKWINHINDSLMRYLEKY